MSQNNNDFKFVLDRKSGVPKKEVKYTKEYAIAEIMRFADANPNIKLTASSYEKWPSRDGNRHSLANVFGGWTPLMQAAGIENSRYVNKVITDEQCVEYFEKVWVWKGKQPSGTDLKEYGFAHPNETPISSFTYGRRWGGLPRFAKLFVDYKNEKISLQKLIAKKESKIKRKPISPRLRAKVFQRDNKTCQDCGRTIADGVKLEVHHKDPVSKGGTNELDNLTTNCEDCNKGKSDKILDLN